MTGENTDIPVNISIQLHRKSTKFLLENYVLQGQHITNMKELLESWTKPLIYVYPTEYAQSYWVFLLYHSYL